MQVRKYIHQSFLSAILFLYATNVFAAKTDFYSDNNQAAQSRIVASFYDDNGEKKLIAGFEIKLKDGWYAYGKDDQEQNNLFGNPPTFNFANSQNIDISKSNIIFPKPTIMEEVIVNDVIRYAIYKDYIVIPIELSVVDPSKETNLQIEVNYGLCKEICIPIAQKFSLNLPPAESDLEALQIIQKYLDKKSITNQSDQKVSESREFSIKSPLSLWKALLIAFIGGAILNIMPCVLPVLSIKLLSVINHSQAKIARIRFAFLSTTLGIIFSFTVFATFAVILKSIGSNVGWGFQFQNPYFLLFLLIVLMVFISNLLGCFEFSTSSNLNSIINNKINSEEERKSIFLPNFLSGILAVLLATPCSAPFVGVAISFALGSNSNDIFLIFIVMGLGLAFPYLFLIIFPQLVKMLPKPGSWMIRAKNIMAGLLAATAIWLIYILVDNIGFIAASSAAILSIFILLFFKLAKKIKSLWIKTVIFIAIVGLIFVVPNRLAYLDKMMEKEQQEHWIKFDESQISQLVLEGKVVVVDITADWCITCKANKLLVLSSKEITNKLSQQNIVAMRGDLTKPDQKISEFMQKYNRYGIPFNIVFGPNAPDGILTSELLSKDDLLKLIDQASGDIPAAK